MIATQLVRTLEVSAASGLVLRDGRFHVVADDENVLFEFTLQGETRRTTLLEGELPAAKSERKARKADFEILVDLHRRGLLAMGSGSRPTRERAVLVAAGGEVRVINMTPLCTWLRRDFTELNLEGGALAGGELVLLQRASRKHPRNALVFLALADLERALDTGCSEVAQTPRIVEVDLGNHEGLPWSFTDVATLGGGDLLATAVLEDTCDAYEDGACVGAALARLAPDGTLRWLHRLDTTAKVEGLAVEGETVWLVSDADDRAIPARLLRTALPA